MHQTEYSYLLSRFSCQFVTVPIILKRAAFSAQSWFFTSLHSQQMLISYLFSLCIIPHFPSGKEKTISRVHLYQNCCHYHTHFSNLAILNGKYCRHEWKYVIDFKFMWFRVLFFPSRLFKLSFSQAPFPFHPSSTPFLSVRPSWQVPSVLHYVSTPISVSSSLTTFISMLPFLFFSNFTNFFPSFHFHFIFFLFFFLPSSSTFLHFLLSFVILFWFSFFGGIFPSIFP